MLVAGLGSRLFGDDGTQPPKCLLRFDGKTLLHRHVEILRGMGVEGLSLVVGYRKEDVEAEITAIGAGDFVETVHNPDYRDGTIISFFAARTPLMSGADILFMDGDVLYHPDLLARLLASDKDNCFLLDRDMEAGEEPVKICVQGDRLVDFGKQVQDDYDVIGEWPGFMCMNSDVAAGMVAAAAAAIDAGRKGAPYEDAMVDVLRQSSPATFGYEDITGIPWIEIDFPEDLERARTVILPLLD